MRSQWGRRELNPHLHDDQRVLRRCPKSVMLPVTPQPRIWRLGIRRLGFRFVWRVLRIVSFLSNFTLLTSNFQSGSPEDRTQRDPRIRRIWATSPRLPCCRFKKVGYLGVEPRPFRSQSGRASICTCIRCCVSSIAADASVGAYLPCQWAGRRSNPRLRFFRPPLDRLSYQPDLAG